MPQLLFNRLRLSGDGVKDEEKDSYCEVFSPPPERENTLISFSRSSPLPPPLLLPFLLPSHPVHRFINKQTPSVLFDERKLQMESSGDPSTDNKHVPRPRSMKRHLKARPWSKEYLERIVVIWCKVDSRNSFHGLGSLP